MLLLGAVLAGSMDFGNARIHGVLRLGKSSQFDGAHFLGDASFAGMRVDGSARFAQVRFDGPVEMNWARFLTAHQAGLRLKK